MYPVVLSIRDSNDNDPVFLNLPYETSVNEVCTLNNEHTFFHEHTILCFLFICMCIFTFQMTPIGFDSFPGLLNQWI